MGSEVIFRGQFRRAAALLAGAAAVVALTTMSGEAHKPITSPYTFDKDVLPIVRNKCGQCHVEGGVAPMSLLTATDATPWAESIRTELIAGHMPPWPVDVPATGLRNDTRLTGRELNTLLTWATGGTPAGDPAAPPPHTRASDWPLGPPDLELPLDQVTVPANQQEEDLSFVVPTGTTSRRFVRAVDLRPGTTSIVRSARIVVKAADIDARGGAAVTERVLALWQPGETPVPLDRGLGFELPAGAQLEVQVRYKKTWQYEGKAMQDRSRIAIYFAGNDARPVQALTLQARVPASAPPVPAGVVGGVVEGLPASGAREVLAVYPDAAMAHVRATVEIRIPGSSNTIFSMRPDPAWARRYWFTQPVQLPEGAQLEVRFEPYSEPAILRAPGQDASTSTPRAITLDVVQ